MWLSLLGLPAAAADPVAEAERLQEEVRALARAGRWDGVELAWKRLLATGVPPSPEACQQAADAAQQRGRLIDVEARLECAADTPDNRDRLAAIHGSTTRVALFARPSDAFEPEQMPFQPDAAKAIRLATEGLDEDGFWFGLLPVGRYKLGEATLALEPGTTLVAVGSGDQAQSDAPADPQLAPFGGRWLDVPLSARWAGAAVRSDRDAAPLWRTGGGFQLGGIGGIALGIGGMVAGALIPTPRVICNVPRRADYGPITTGVGGAVAILGAASFAGGTALRAMAASEAEESFPP